MQRKLWMVLLAALCALAIGACGGDDDDDNGNGGETKSVEITAASGGKVEAAGATLDIPAGALAEDTTITVTAKSKDDYAGSENVAGEVFDFGPDGLKFLKPVTLTMDFDPAAAPKGMKAAVAYHDGKAWVNLPGSAVSGSTVAADTTHFTPFTVVWTVGGGTNDTSCDEFKFTPCGGDLVGTWTYSGSCLDAAGFDPFEGSGLDCPGLGFSATFDLNGTATFNADGSFSSKSNTTVTGTLTIPKSCFGKEATCDMFDDEEATFTDTGDACQRELNETETDESTGTWKVEGNVLTIEEDDDTDEPEPIDFCVEGDSASFAAQASSDFPVKIYYTATRN